jgi:hypothetical protein
MPNASWQVEDGLVFENRRIARVTDERGCVCESGPGEP